jgi:hypothetical protein
VLVRGISSEPEFFVGLHEQIFRATGVATKVIVVVYLSGVDPLPRRLNVLLSGPQIAVPFAYVYSRSLGENCSTAAQDQAHGRSDEQVFLNDHDEFSL